MDVGAKHFYISNPPVARAQAVLGNILAKADVTAQPQQRVAPAN